VISLFHASAALGNKKSHFNCPLFLLSEISGALVKTLTAKRSDGLFTVSFKKKSVGHWLKHLQQTQCWIGYT
jgi:hypothetical protein